MDATEATMDKAEKADRLYDLAVEEHRAAYVKATRIQNPQARQLAFQRADEIFGLQREYQRKVRHGEVQS